jgi:hypothetical protein
MKDLIFRIRKSTPEEVAKSVAKNKGSAPWMYMKHLEYWCDGDITKPSDGSMTLCNDTTIHSIIESVKRIENMI